MGWLLLFLVIPIIGLTLDLRDWNGGIAPCGNEWVYFDTDSQGGRGYNCADRCHGTWISYPWIDDR